MNYKIIFGILLFLIFSINVASATTLNVSQLSNNIKYSNATEYSTDCVNCPVLLSTITITNSIIGRQNLTVEFKKSGTKAAYISIRKNGVEITSSSTASLTYISYQFNTTDFTWNVGDIYELYAYVGSGCCGGDLVYVRNFNMSYDIASFPLQAVFPTNGSNVTSPTNITWKEAPLNFSYDYIIASDNQFINTIQTGTISSSTTQNITVPLSLDIGTYFWKVTNSSGNYSNIFNFTVNPAPATPGRFNITVWDEQNISKQILNYSVQLYNSTSVVVKNSSYPSGWTNFSTEISSGEYLIIVVPGFGYTNYYQRMVLNTSPSNVTMYVPNGTNNTIDLVAFSLYDLTSLFPFTTSTISVYKGELLQDKSYFSADGTHPVYMIQGTNYQIQIQNGNNIFVYQNYIPLASGTSQITTSNFFINTSNINPFTFNLTSSISDITLNWNDANNSLSQFNFTVHKGDPMVQICQLTTSVKHGQSICIIDNTTIYHVIFLATMTDGTFKNQTMYIDYRVGTRQNSTGTSTIDGNATGIGFIWNYGTFVMPNWVYNWISVILVIVLFGSFGARDAGFGAIIGSVVLLIFEGVGWFRPIDNDATQALVMGLSIAFLVFSVVYYMQHKDRGG